MADFHVQWIRKLNKNLLGEAPIWKHAAAQKCRETPMGQPELSNEGFS